MKQICTIKVHKDSLPILSHCNIIYEINCLPCEASYVTNTPIIKNKIYEYKGHRKKYEHL